MKSGSTWLRLQALLVIGVMSCSFVNAMDSFDLSDFGDLDSGSEQTTTGFNTGSKKEDSSAKKSSLSDTIKWEEEPDELKDAAITTNEERGNWFFKAKILKDARKMYEKIRKLIAKIEPLEDTFAAERNKVDGKLNKFYQEYGFKGGEAEERLDALTQELEDLEKSEGSLDRDQRSLLADARQKKDDVEAVKKDFEQLQKFDAAINQAIATLAAQVNKARAYDEQAWKDYEKIELVLNDEVAEDLFRKIENAYDNCVSIDGYLKKEFKKFFDTSVKSINELVSSVTKQVTDLKEKGVALGEKMTKMLEEEESARRAKEQRERERLKAELAKAQRGWFAVITDGVAFAWQKVVDAVTDVFGWVKGLFGGSKKESSEACPVPEKQSGKQPEEVSPSAEPESVEKEKQPEVDFEALLKDMPAMPPVAPSSAPTVPAVPTPPTS